MSDTKSTRTLSINAEFTAAPPKRYFPAGCLGETAELSQFAENSYSAHLTAFDEPSLFTLAQQDCKSECYRFLWLRSFHPPISIRIEVNADDTGKVITKIGGGASGFGVSKPTRERTHKLAQNKAGLFVARMHFYGFWELPTLESGLALDGAAWILEGAKHGKYHVVDRHSPKDGPIHKLGLTMMIDFAKLKLLYQEVY